MRRRLVGAKMNRFANGRQCIIQIRYDFSMSKREAVVRSYTVKPLSRIRKIRAESI